MHAVDEMNKNYYNLFKRSGLLQMIDVYCYSDYSGRGWFKTEYPQWSNFKHYRLVPKSGYNKNIWDQFLKNPSKVFMSFNNIHWFSLKGAEDIPIDAPSFINNILYKIVECPTDENVLITT